MAASSTRIFRITCLCRIRTHPSTHPQGTVRDAALSAGVHGQIQDGQHVVAAALGRVLLAPARPPAPRSEDAVSRSRGYRMGLAWCVPRV
jgi:hypothetical protein